MYIYIYIYLIEIIENMQIFHLRYHAMNDDFQAILKTNTFLVLLQNRDSCGEIWANLLVLDNFDKISELYLILLTY